MSKTVVLNTRAVKWTDYMTPVAMIMSNSYNSSVSLMVLVGIIAINVAISAAMILGYTPVIHIIQALFLAFVEFAVVVLVYYYYKRNSTTAQTDN
jgi:threonine/homoserine/homoserine lactone efflux protein